MIWIFGDSFSTNDTRISWTRQLGSSTIKVSFNGISEYRILQSIKVSIEHIQPSDTVIICHTNPYRVYIPDHIPYPARNHCAHAFCDLVISDSMNRNFMWRLISKVYFKYFFDEEHSTELNNLIIEKQIMILGQKSVKVIEISGFNGMPNSFHDVFVNNPGKINHMNCKGNELVANRIRELL